ncbi:MAG: DUF1553 domain-containing protein [Blastocatellales bacterium]|nr:DUF1553 domain-containing protein [Blastocatellales bacterium]
MLFFLSASAQEEHWALVAPSRPRLPEVEAAYWVRNPIDRFILARLESENLRPSPEADRAALLRRVTLDLTGLPPTIAELEAFLADRAPNAYEKVVDRLLASPRYGERMAFRWLDAARYADTNGYQIDGERSMWRWRDWVIEAFNRNLSYDRFIIEQLAGDLLPGATMENRLATAFNRNHRTNSEDGIVPEEYAVEYVVDRVDTFSTVFMGLTVGCARCHNHKYDPISQRDYYRLYAYFNNIAEDGRASNYGNSPPWMVAPTREQAAELARLDRAMERARNRLAALAVRHRAQERRWERTLADQSLQWFPGENLVLHHPLDEGAEPVIGATEQIDPAKPEVTPIRKAEQKKDEIGFKNGAARYVDAPTGRGAAFDGNVFYDAGKTANFNFRDRLRDYKDQFAISAWFYPESATSGAIVTHMQDAAGETDGGLPKGRGYGLFFVNGKLHFNIVSVWADDAFRTETAEALELRKWHHVVAVFDSTEPYEKAGIYVNGRKARLNINLGRLFRTFGDANANLRIGGGGGPEFRFKGAIDEVRIYKSVPDREELAILSTPESLDRIARIPAVQRTEAQRLKLRRAYWEIAAPDQMRALWADINNLRGQRSRLEAELPTVMVMQELSEARPAYVLKRGAYDMPGERVERGAPSVLPQIAKSEPNNRLGLARWLVRSDHPLTARVAVNRFWSMFFGAGLVRTPEDFGEQGEAPTHPELLDWLAVEFRELGWDVKALLKLIVTSAAYRQSSHIAPDVFAKDPENRLLARAPRLRLPAEMIRDSALFASGLLVEKLGGPSVKPYQPPGLYKDMVFSNMTEYDQAKDEGLWRRSIYTYWKRTVMPPGMHIFDASARENCTVREPRTNTPLQALNLMNDVAYVEAARLLAARMIKEGGVAPEDRLKWAFRLLTARQPGEGELRILLDNLHAQIKHFRERPEAALQLLATGEKRVELQMDAADAAGYTATASLLLNLDEAVTRQ